MSEMTQIEIDALRCLTQAGCSSSPALLVWKHETQSNTGWVPGGFVDYILMEKVPGSKAPDYRQSLPPKERDRLLKAFKAAYLECMARGRVHHDSGDRGKWYV
ncbi:hypothetical protein BDV30DRAFT_245065 [Aspergillus minisclerotigenes]|uniref:Uncharacterized protein n=1 Tax=Aspergillus minisclerotigenes TaxID=656917 RepID=A0A5N6IND6_9EURO|nr:hypothetical protein BDV30DRAFT_245065 [Aspergillus minisclerotigenes]